MNMKRFGSLLVALSLLAATVAGGCTERDAERTQESPSATDNSRPGGASK